MSETDLQLLTRYTRHRAEDAFAEVVRRHLDLVHSAAVRQVRSTQLAEEVAQSVFTDLARQAHQLPSGTVLAAWLYQVTRRTAIDVVRREAARRLREQVATEMNTMNATSADWTAIEPLLDEAMHALDDTDRTAVLLRYFETKSLREVGETLGTSDDAAQKRVSRAVERLREFFGKRGVTIGASGLVVVMSAHAVQAAPLGLFLTISSAALTGTTIATTATAAVGKAIAMTTLQKTLIATTLVAAVGAGIYETHEALKLRSQGRTVDPQLSKLTEQLTRERDDAVNRVMALQGENQRLSLNTAELLRLRGEVGALRRQTNELAKLREEKIKLPQISPEEAQAPSEIMELVRAKQFYISTWLEAFFAYAKAHQGQCPETFQQAAPFLPPNVYLIIRTADQFEILYHGSLDTIKDQDIIVFREKALWQHIGGKWGRLYGIADGNAQYCSSSDKTATGSFDEYEKEHTIPLPPQ